MEETRYFVAASYPFENADAWEITRKDFRELGIDALPVIAVRADEIVKIINEELLAASEGIK